MKVNMFGITENSIVDGPGVRYAIFFRMCPHHCPGCHNPESQRMDIKEYIDSQKIIDDVNKTKDIKGVTISGGEPFFQPEALKEITSKLHKNHNIWVFTGYLWEELIKKHKDILKNIDILVDGPFILAQRNLALYFKGSSNQRIIDVQQSLKQGKIVLDKYNDMIAE